MGLGRTHAEPAPLRDDSQTDVLPRSDVQAAEAVDSVLVDEPLTEPAV